MPAQPMMIECRTGGGSDNQGRTVWIEASKVTIIESRGSECVVHVCGGSRIGIDESCEAFMKRWQLAVEGMSI